MDFSAKASAIATSWKPRAKVTACRTPSGGGDGPAKKPVVAQVKLFRDNRTIDKEISTN
jgi:hypothetical protein